MKQSQRSYHHGNLKEELLRLTLNVVEKDGHASISVRDIAQAAGVTPMAVYRHFEGRTGLLAAVAGLGMKQLYEAHLRVIDGLSDPWKQLEATMRVFLHYVDVHPRLFALMYDPAVVAEPKSDVEFASQVMAYRSIAALFSSALPRATPREIKLRELAMWSALYGYATARSNGILKGYMLEGLNDAEVVDAVIEAGLGTRS